MHAAGGAPVAPARTRGEPVPPAVAAQPLADDAEYEAFVAFQNVGADNSRRALGGRRATRAG